MYVCALEIHTLVSISVSSKNVSSFLCLLFFDNHVWLRMYIHVRSNMFVGTVIPEPRKPMSRDSVVRQGSANCQTGNRRRSLNHPRKRPHQTSMTDLVGVVFIHFVSPALHYLGLIHC
jgi:hypothetical protein